MLKELDIFELRPLITNLSCKLSTITDYDARKQLLCVVSEENDIVLRYISDGNGGQEVLKLISWFRRTNRVVHDVCFDPTGTWLLVLCFDNTLHIVPALGVVDKAFAAEQQQKRDQAQQPSQPFSATEVTSYIIPFVGPHECPNSKKCPNRSTNHNQHPHTKSSAATNEPRHEEACGGELGKEFKELRLAPAAANKEEPAVEDAVPADQKDNSEEDMVVVVQPATANDQSPLVALEAFSHDVPESMLTAPPRLDKAGTGLAMAGSFMASSTCPYPLSVVWWQTIDGMNRAIIGYSDGSICFVGLSPNCPFVASTAIESGSVTKLLLCKGITFESVMLLITSSLKQQFKLLLEQKAIKYVYPGDNSPSAQQSRGDSDWQIVMPLKTNNSNSSDPASDSSQLDEDVFVKSDESQSTAAASGGSGPVSISCSQAPRPMSTGQMPPPPPYSVAINRHLESAPTNTTAASLGATVSSSTALAKGATTATMAGGGVRFQQQQLPVSEFACASDVITIDDSGVAVAANPSGGANGQMGSTGILPAARARLASLRSLGSKKLNAIKMRLTDNRQKLEEYMPDHSLGPSFAIMDSPSMTPELLGSNTQGSYYTIQNLRTQYLLSALHAQTSSLSVHNIDISLKPMVLYKIPKNCFDILISANILYSIQYVDPRSAESTDTASSGTPPRDGETELTNTEKENRDTDDEKQAKYADDAVDISDEDDRLMEGASTSAAAAAAAAAARAETDSSAETSAATSSGSSTRNEPAADSPNSLINAVGVISSAMASIRSNTEDNFNAGAQIGLFRFENETVLNLYQMAAFRPGHEPTENITKEEKLQAFAQKDIRSPMDYVQFYGSAKHVQEEYSLRQMEIMQSEFPKINYDRCYVVTNKNIYYIQLKKEPFAIFLDAALAGKWKQCGEFCNTFDLNFEACVEFAGDYLLRRKKVTQALLTYNVARIRPIRTALKLAMFGQTTALMHLCAMALKATYTLKGNYFCSPILKTLLTDITYRHSEDVRPVLPPTPASCAGKVVNEGASCSDYTYGVDEVICTMQMSPSSQFHLANLLLITLAEKAVNDKNYLPLWNFLCTNTKYHTNMTSIVLCQSGLFSGALVLAKTRGVCIDTFLALTSVVGQEFGWYSELNVCLYNLSEPMFAETITYVPHVAADYFNFLQDKVESIRPCVLKRLELQLNPFSATLRPIVSHNSSAHLEHNSNDNNSHIMDFCRTLIETYLAILIHMESQRSQRDRIANALSAFRINYEDNQFAIETTRFKPISAGCVHCACVVDGVAYFWGSNGVPCSYSVNKSSDPPEPPHAVKSLELLSQLNLEVHTVKCGRQHTLILTNNGLYTVGNNNYSQLGIGRQLQMSLQPMLVKEFDCKNVTVVEAGQYHSAVVADGLLYTWGWGVYGQLGHGDADDLSEPKVVEFFRNKTVLQVSLGHAHSLVLCRGQPRACEGVAITTELYVFGSNHFGQLGLGSPPAAAATSCEGSQAPCSSDSEACSATQLKSLVPLKLNVGTARIRLIHTKFFTNLAIDEEERMYTWGSSPQALRWANQIKRRANAKQKIEDHQRREMSKRFEAALGSGGGAVTATSSSAAMMSAMATPSTVPPAARCGMEASASETMQGLADAPLSSELNINDLSNIQATEEKLREAAAMAATQTDAAGTKEEQQEEAALRSASNISLAGDIEEVHFREDADASRSRRGIGMELLDDVVAEGTAKPQRPSAKQATRDRRTSEELLEEKKIEFAQNKQSSVEVDPCEHMSPHIVDTSEVAGQILQVSSGLFHFALISSSCTLYTWGKNLEHQLGTEDKERRAVNKPAPVDSIERPKYVDCGADFTLVMTTDYVVKAFGGNSNGQCGRDLGPTLDKTKQRPVCMPTTKRIMRFEGQCVEAPVEINLPRPRIRLDHEPVRYLKSIPRFEPHFVQEADINLGASTSSDDGDEHASPPLQYVSTTQAESSAITEEQESDDLLSSLENLSNNEISSLNLSLNAPASLAEVEGEGQDLLSDDATPGANIAAPPPPDMKDNRAANTNNPFEPHSTLTSSSAVGAAAAAAAGNAEDEAELRELRHYIHYCLYIFHGLYDPDKVREFSRGHRLEYRIRTHMLNFKYVEAFQLCLLDCATPTKTLRLFEYFSKDASGCVPLRRHDMKFLIYHLLLHFLGRKFDMADAEQHFIADLDYYLLELAYVLYFNNNNTVLEQNLNQKFKHLMAQEEPTVSGGGQYGPPAERQQQAQAQPEHKMEDTDVIFDSLSVKFKAIICQRLLKYCTN